MANDEEVERGKCAGCNTRLYAKSYYYQNYVEGEFAPGRVVRVCRGRGARASFFDAKMSCLLAARKKLAICAGCGEDVRNFVARPLCSDCQAAIERARAMDASAESKAYAIVTSGLLPYLPDGRDVSKEAADLLAQIAAGPRRCSVNSDFDFGGTFVEQIRNGPYGSHTTSDPIVEMDARQAKAVSELTKLLYELAKAYEKAGFAEGNDLLGRLAKGDTTVKDYDERVERARKRK